MIPKEQNLDITTGQDIHDFAVNRLPRTAGEAAEDNGVNTEPREYTPYRQSAMQNAIQDAAWGWEVGAYQPSEDIGVQGQNDSYYDQYIYNREDLEDLNEVRAREQGLMSKIGGGIGRFGTITVMGTVGNVVGTVAGIFNGAEEAAEADPEESKWDKFWEGFWNNKVNNFVNDVINDVNENTPIYESAHDRDAGIFERITSGNFWSNFIGNMGWTSAMILSTVLTGGMGVASLGSKVATLLGASKNTAIWTYRLLGACTGSMSEAATEAINGYKEAEQDYTKLIQQQKELELRQLDDRIMQEFQSEKERLGISTNPEIVYRVNGLTAEEAILQNIQAKYAGERQNIEDKYAQQLSTVEKNATAAGTNIFGMNVLWLTLSNSLGVFSNVTSPMANLNRVAKGSWANLFSPKGQWKAASRKELLAREGIEAIAQGNEEMLQGGAAETAKAYYGQYYNPEFTGELRDYMSVAYEQYKNVYSDPKMWEEFMSGFFLGLTGAAGAGNKRIKGDNGYTNTIRPEWTGGIISSIRESKEDAERGSQIYEEANGLYNKYINDKNLQARAKFVIGTLADKEAMAQAVDDNDKKKFLDEEGNSIIRMCETFADIGRVNDLKAMVGSDTNMSDDDIREFVAINSEEIKDENGVGTGKYKSNLPIITATGELMSGTPEGINEIRERLKKDQKQVNSIINTYVDTIEKVDASTGYGLTRDQLQVLTWMRMKGLLSEERLNKMTANELSKLLKGKLLAAWRTNRLFRSDNDDDYIGVLEKKAEELQNILDTFNTLSSEELDSENTYSADETKVLRSKLDKVNKAIEIAKKTKRSNEAAEEEKPSPSILVEKYLENLENNLTEDNGAIVAAMLRTPLITRTSTNEKGEAVTKTLYLADIIQELLEESYGNAEPTESANKIMNDIVRLHKDMTDYDRTFREYLAIPQKTTELLNDVIQTSNKARLKYKTGLMLRDLSAFTAQSDNDQLLEEDKKQRLNDYLSHKINDEFSSETEENQNYIKEALRSNSPEYDDYFSNEETSNALKNALDTLDTQNDTVTPNIGVTKEFITKLGNTYSFLDYRYSTREDLVNKALELGYTAEQAFEIVANLRKATAVIAAQQIVQQKIFEEAQKAAQEKGKTETVQEEEDGDEYSPRFTSASLTEDTLTEEDKELNKIFKSKSASDYFKAQLQKYAKEITGNENASIDSVLKAIYSFEDSIYSLDGDAKETVTKYYRKFEEALQNINASASKEVIEVKNNKSVHKMVKTKSDEEIANLKKEWVKNNTAEGEKALKTLISYGNYINALTCYLANTSKDGVLDKSIVYSKGDGVILADSSIISDIVPMLNDKFLHGSDGNLPAYSKALDKDLPSVPEDEGSEPLSIIDEDSVENTFSDCTIEYKPIPSNVKIEPNKVVVGQTVYTLNPDGSINTKVTLYKKSDTPINDEENDEDDSDDVVLSNNGEEEPTKPSETTDNKNGEQKPQETPAPTQQKSQEIEDYLDESDDTDEVTDEEQRIITELLNEDTQQGATEQQSNAVAKFNNLMSEFDNHVFFDEDTHSYYIYYGDGIEQAKKDFQNKNYSSFTRATKSPSKLRYPEVATTEAGRRTGNATRGRTIGDDVDLIVREYFKGSSKNDVAEQLKFFPKDSPKFDAVWSACGEIETRIKEAYPDSIILTDTYKLASIYREPSGDTILAGSPDMIVIDRDGVAHVFDMKALAESQILSQENKAEHPNGTNSYEMYQVQTLAYANILNANGIPTDTETARLIQFNTENNTVKLLEDFAIMQKDETSDTYTNPIQSISFSNYAKPNTSIADALSAENAEVLNEDTPQQDITPTESFAVSEEEQKTLDTNTTEETTNDIEFDSTELKKKVGNREQLGFMITDYLEYEWKSEQEGEYVRQFKGSAICDFLRDSGVYDFLNSGKLKKHQKIYCREITGDIRTYYGNLYENDLSKAPSIDAVIGLFVMYNGKMQCIGAIDIDSDAIGGIGSYTGEVDTAHNIRNNISIAVIPAPTSENPNPSKWVNDEDNARRFEKLGFTGKVINSGNVVEVNLKASVDKARTLDATSDNFALNQTYVSLKNENGQSLSVAGVLPGRIQVKPKKDSRNDLVPVRTINVGRKSFDDAFRDGDVYIGSTFSVDKKIIAVNSKGENVMIEGLKVPFDTGSTLVIYRGGDGKWRCSAALGRTITYADAIVKSDNAIINKIKWAINAKGKKGSRGIAALMAAQSNILKTDSPFHIANLSNKVEKNALNIFKHLNLQPKEITYESATNTLNITLKDGTIEVIKGNNKSKEAIEKEIYSLLEKYKARFSMSQAVYLNQNNSVSSKNKAKLINSLADLSVSNIENFSTRNTRVALSYVADLTPTVIQPEHTKSSNYTEIAFGNLALRKKDDNTYVLTTGKHQLTANEVASLFQLKLSETEKPNIAILINDLLTKLYGILESNVEITETLNDANRDVYNGVMKLTGVKNLYKQVLFDLTTQKALPRNISFKKVQTSGWRNANQEVVAPSLFDETPTVSADDGTVTLEAIETPEEASAVPDNKLPEIEEAQAAAVIIDDAVEEVKQEVTNIESEDIGVIPEGLDHFLELTNSAISETDDFDPDKLPAIITSEGISLNLNEGSYNIHEFIDKYLPQSDLTRLLKKVISKKATLEVLDADKFSASFGYNAGSGRKIAGLTQYGSSVVIPSDVSVETVIHELVHYTIPDITLDKEAYAAIKSAYDIYKAYLNLHYTTQRQSKLGIKYATTNVVEFMSELLSNKAVADTLNSIPVDYMYRDATGDLVVNPKYRSNDTANVNVEAVEKSAKRDNLLKRIVNAIMNFFRRKATLKEPAVNWYSIAKNAGMSLIESFTDNTDTTFEERFKKEMESFTTYPNLQNLYVANDINTIMPIKPFIYLCTIINSDIYGGTYLSNLAVSNISRAYGIEHNAVKNLSLKLLKYIDKTKKPLGIIMDMSKSSINAKDITFATKTIDNEAQFNSTITNALANTLNAKLPIKNGFIGNGETSIGKHTLYQDAVAKLNSILLDKLLNKLDIKTKKFLSIATDMVNSYYENTNVSLPNATDSMIAALLGGDYSKALYTAKALSVMPYNSSDMLSHIFHLLNNALQGNNISTTELSKSFSLIREKVNSVEFDDINDVTRQKELAESNAKEFNKATELIVKDFKTSTPNKVVTLISNVYKKNHLGRILDAFTYKDSRRNVLSKVVETIVRDNNMDYSDIDSVIDEVEDGLFGYPSPRVQPIIDTYNVLSNLNNRLILKQFEENTQNNLNNSDKTLTFAEQIDYCKL